ncbi:unknown protein [Oryza sativa Japonica Group]|uniref:Uncharacterized protein n=1 Tax=Oryza sativa subsp. japonica TaxID=39947 RepID=Q5QM09_ORYSJ|nr:unknown protein [Oryza sativa Japonica Group]
MAAVRRTEATMMRPSTRWNTGGLVEAATTVMLCGGLSGRDKSTAFDLAGCGFEEEGYPVVDYESTLQNAKSTTNR